MSLKFRCIVGKSTEPWKYIYVHEHQWVKCITIIRNCTLFLMNKLCTVHAKFNTLNCSYDPVYPDMVMDVP